MRNRATVLAVVLPAGCGATGVQSILGAVRSPAQHAVVAGCALSDGEWGRGVSVSRGAEADSVMGSA